MSKKIKKIGIIILLFLSLSLSLLYFLSWFYIKREHPWFGETMSIKQVCKKWGTIPFNAVQFKKAEGNESIRAKMACSLLKNQNKYIGKYRWEIRKLLGDYSGYYFSERIPTYFIEIGKNKKEETWQIVFLIDSQEKISQIIIHKNCCYND